MDSTDSSSEDIEFVPNKVVTRKKKVAYYNDESLQDEDTNTDSSEEYEPSPNIKRSKPNIRGRNIKNIDIPKGQKITKKSKNFTVKEQKQKINKTDIEPTVEFGLGADNNLIAHKRKKLISGKKNIINLESTEDGDNILERSNLRPNIKKEPSSVRIKKEKKKSNLRDNNLVANERKKLISENKNIINLDSTEEEDNILEQSNWNLGIKKESSSIHIKKEKSISPVTIKKEKNIPIEIKKENNLSLILIKKEINTPLIDNKVNLYNVKQENESEALDMKGGIKTELFNCGNDQSTEDTILSNMKPRKRKIKLEIDDESVSYEPKPKKLNIKNYEKERPHNCTLKNFEVNKKYEIGKSSDNTKMTIKKELKSEGDFKLEDTLTKPDKGIVSDSKPLSGSQIRLGSGVQWEADLLAEECRIDFKISRNIVNMFRNECTVPFIARYRCELTNGMDADTLRHVKESHTKIKKLEAKATTVLNQIKKTGKLTAQVENNIYGVRSLDELEHIYAPFKPGGKKTKSARACELGLEKIAIDTLKGNSFTNTDINNMVDASTEGLKSIDQVLEGMKYIIADIFSKDTDVLEYLRTVQKQADIRVTSTKSVTKKKNDDKRDKKMDDEDGKFQIYYDFSVSIKNIQPHQILALNRGENQKILSVKFSVPDWLMNKLKSFCWNRWMTAGCKFQLRTQLFNDSFKDSYNRLIQPLIIRRVRSQLNDKAEHAAIENFASNLKSLLLQPPVRGCPILGIDPGFRKGCKMALISGSGDVLWTSTLCINCNAAVTSNDPNIKIIRKHLYEYRCELLAIGNGLGCREMEKYICDHIKNGAFQPELDVQYTIVNERGSSIYSCTSLAKEEFPDLEPNVISAVFIARSLQDPLSELVKVEPKHLGVGMYQHDMPEKELNHTLEEIVSASVSFAGVDINTASVYLLKRVAGMNSKRAASIIECRNKNGPFLNRHQILEVKGIGEKTYEQCVGFIRVIPETVINSEVGEEVRRRLMVPLDRTWIHPESYILTYRFVDLCGVNLENLGTSSFIQKVNDVTISKGMKEIANILNAPEQTILLIKEALTKPLDYDYRAQFAKPMFKKDFVSFESLRPNMELTGYITNVTSFGAFADVGVKTSGLIHISNMNGAKLKVGDRVRVKVLSIEVHRNRLSLLLISQY